MLVKIKPWDNMEDEFGLDRDGDISTKFACFTKEMENIIPEDRIIKVSPRSLQMPWTTTKYYDYFEDNHYQFTVTDDMIEEVVKE